MKKIKNINYFLFIILILCIILILLYYRKKLSKQINNPINNYNLEKDGLHIIKNILSNDEIYQLKNNYHSIKDYIINNKRINNIIKIYTNKDYQFQDYIFIIKKSSIHTCHRDNNGDFFNKGQKYPSYTIIIYLEKMDKCLGVIPKSHLNKNSFNFNITDPIKNIICNPGDAIIFNANLIHVGTLNKNDNNLRIQMKITHKDDRNTLYFYENYNKQLNNPSKYNTKLQKLQKHISCSFPIISKYTEKYDKNKNNNDNLISKLLFAKLDNI
jgi:hypothetical protein